MVLKSCRKDSRVSTGISVLVVGAPKNRCHQCLGPRGVSCSCPPPPSPGDSPRPAGQSGPDSYQVTSSVLCPGSHKILCASLKDEASIFYSFLGPLKAPWPSKSTALGAHLPGSGPLELNIGFRPLTLVGEPLKCNYSPACGAPAGDMELGYIVGPPLFRHCGSCCLCLVLEFLL